MAHDSYSALSDLTRRRILTALSHGARPVGELVRELEVSQPTVSKHLKVLRDVGLVTTRAEGQRRYYSIEVETLADVARWIEELIGYLPAPEQGTALGPEPEAAGPEAEPATENSGEPKPEPGAPEAEPEAADTEEPAARAPAVPEPRPLPWFAVAAAEAAAYDPLPDTMAGETAWEKTVLPQSENQDAGSTVETDTDVDSAATSEGSPGSAESSLTKPEPGVPLVRSGAAHRRQGGLLSTLTGFRRRGRDQRR